MASDTPLGAKLKALREQIVANGETESASKILGEPPMQAALEAAGLFELQQRVAELERDLYDERKAAQRAESALAEREAEVKRLRRLLNFASGAADAKNDEIERLRGECAAIAAESEPRVQSFTSS